MKKKKVREAKPNFRHRSEIKVIQSGRRLVQEIKKKVWDFFLDTSSNIDCVLKWFHQNPTTFAGG